MINIFILFVRAALVCAAVAGVHWLARRLDRGRLSRGLEHAS
jgi:hypothetical protein